MSRAKRQHLIPQFILRNFTDSTGSIYYFRKESAERGIVKTTPKNVFVEADVYSLRKEGGQIDVSLEEKFSHLESAASPVVANILTAVSAGKTPMLSRQDRIVLNYLIYHQWTRVSDVMDPITAGVPFEQMVEDAKRRAEAAGQTVSAEDEQEIVASREILIQNAKVQALGSTSSKVMPLLQKRGLLIFHIETSDLSLCLGSNPIIRGRNNDSVSLEDLEVEVIFPIAAHTALVLRGGYPYSYQVRPLSDESIVRDFNDNVFRQSTAVAANSSELLTALAKRLDYRA